jgi:hypothetical protein
MPNTYVDIYDNDVSWTPRAGAKWIEVMCIGGGAGGGAGAYPTGTRASGGVGGQGAAQSVEPFDPLEISGSIDFVIGLGGVGTPSVTVGGVTGARGGNGGITTAGPYAAAQGSNGNESGQINSTALADGAVGAGTHLGGSDGINQSSQQVGFTPPSGQLSGMASACPCGGNGGGITDSTATIRPGGNGGSFGLLTVPLAQFGVGGATTGNNATPAAVANNATQGAGGGGGAADNTDVTFIGGDGSDGVGPGAGGGGGGCSRDGTGGRSGKGGNGGKGRIIVISYF